MTRTIILKEHGPESEPLDLEQIDIEWINKENGKEEEQYHRDLKKLEIKPSSDPGCYILKAKGHVGSISLPSGKFIINIEPKFENAWNNLFKLFEYTETIDPNFGTGDVHAKEGKTLWDILAKVFIKNTMRLIKSGLYRTYILKIEEITPIRGRLLLAQNIRSAQKFRTKHWCEFDDLSYDIPENQCILYCTSLLLRYVHIQETKQELVKIKNIILSQNITLKNRFTFADANSITIHRMNKKYDLLFRYCKLILKSLAYEKFSDVKGLPIPDFTINMWDLFEKFVNKVLVDHYKHKSINIHFQRKYKNLLERIVDYPNLKKYSNPPKLEPDNILSSKEGPRLILDTKWKKEVASGDWYQVISYSLALKCDTILLLPKFENKYSDGFKIPKEFAINDLTIHVKTVDFEQASKSQDFIEDLKIQIHEIVDGVKLK